MNHNLRHYPLPERIVRNLQRADALAMHMHRTGQQIPEDITVSASDFATANRIVRAFAGDAHDVSWNGRKLSVAA